MSVAPRRSTPAFLQVDAILGRLGGTQALTEVCRYLRGEFPHYRWIGIYRLDGETLVLDGWDGEQPTEHTRIPLDRGICGMAARENRTVIVDDVSADPAYLQCFLDTRSEIVVPIRDGDRVLGEIDIDGREVGAYDRTDEAFLTGVAERLRPLLRPAVSAAGSTSSPPAGGASPPSPP
ncbi:MAG TPA: GAF domain-containing protein [Thermoplasmata archaeon]|nr:GAF domain-containing protein [Thermoplasmata archaeon]